MRYLSHSVGLGITGSDRLSVLVRTSNLRLCNYAIRATPHEACARPPG